MAEQSEKAVLTIAVGKRLYLDMAVNLARSFLVWHRGSNIKFFLATDSVEPQPKDLEGISIIRLQPGQYGSGFSPKLHLDRISPAQETLFIDADCLCAANLESVFAKFKDREVSVIGSEETEGELFGDIAQRCQAMGVKWIPRFCGGIYYFKKGPVSAKVFEKARELEKRYDELGMARLRGVPNEEPLIGLSMAMADQHPVPEDGSIKAEPMFFRARAELDVFSGHARLFNPPGTPHVNPAWKTPTEARPVVVHFNSSFAEEPPYTTEALRLEKVLARGWPLPMATVYAWLTRTFPFVVKTKTKDILRPVYRAFAGYRPLKHSPRV